MQKKYAIVTLLTTDSYLPGALTSLHSLLEAEGRVRANDFDTVCLVTPATVSVETLKALRQAFTLVIGVEPIESHATRELALLGRPDLHSTFTKLHLWRLTQYEKIIYLDADTLVLRPLSHLFTATKGHELSAAPDIGWPDCFNSGLMVLEPSEQTFRTLQEQIATDGSWDGADQGLLNDAFPRWNRLSFTYNVTPSASYQYEPALQRYGQNISMLHFIGANKPWDRLNRARTSPSSGRDYEDFLNKWFDVYERHYGQISTAALSNATSQSFQAPFQVPFYANAWDKKGLVPYHAPDPQELQTSNYTNMWDGAKKDQTRSNQALDYHVPSSVQSDYASVMRASMRQDIKPVFPWESTQTRASRIFPDDATTPRQAGSVQPSLAASAPPALQSKPASNLPVDFNYTNAWDSIKGIRTYAKHLGQPATPKQATSWSAVDVVETEETKSLRTTRRGNSSRRSESLEREGDEGDDEEDQDERPPIKLRSARSSQPTIPARQRPYMRRAQDSVGSHSRVPTVDEMLVNEALPDLPSVQADLPSVQAKASHASSARVFSPSTDTGIVRKEGLAALQRFVQSMDAKGSHQTSPAGA